MPRVARKWLRNPSDTLAVAEGCTFDLAAGTFACEFIEGFCRQSKGRWAGKPLVLFDWQRDFVMRLFGWKRADGRRRFRRAYLEVAKKQGKSTLCSALVLYLLLADEEGGPEVYLNACDRDQAAIVFEEAARMVKASPELSKRLEIVDSKADKRIVDPAGNGKIVVNSSVAASKDGLNPSAVVFDELHRQPDRRLWGVFEFACRARDQPLILSITTAGEAAEGVWYDQREHSEKVNAGVIPDTSHLGVVYRALEGDDLDDPKTWRKANPSLGATTRVEDFARDLADAKLDPAALANFLRLRLNIITREEAKFVDMGAWEACSEPPAAAPGEHCWAGLDLSETEDLSALVWLQGDPEAGFDVQAKFWLPAENIVALARKHRVPYEAWARAGWIELTDGNVIDYGWIRKAINDLADAHELRLLLADPHNATQLLTDLEQSDGLAVQKLRQGFLSLSAPTKELHRMIAGRRLRHGNHPVLRWMAGNAVVVRDPAGNIKLDRSKSRQKIDGMAALVNAIAAATGDEQGGRSLYETQGFRTL